MHWQNTVRKQEQGALYVWDKDGRPQVLGSIFTYQFQNRVHCRHEMISLADRPLTSKLGSTVVWTPKRAGVAWKPCDDVPPPMESAPRRLTQMRAIARQFTGTLDIPDYQLANLTLIPQPLVRYQATNAGVIDGAVFSFAVVTDPEILLVVEARESNGESGSWHYAAARAHYEELELKRKGSMVWQAARVKEMANTRFAQLPYAAEPYFVFFPPQPLPPPEALR